VTLEQFQRAELVRFAYEEAAHTGSIQCLKAVVYVLRNRVRSGWSPSFLEAIRKADAVRGNHVTKRPEVNENDRIFQIMLRDIDEVYYGTAQDETEKLVDQALYYQFIDRVISPWFVENIVRSAEHPRRAQIGTMMLFA
jgi:hypothetical protein